MAYFSWETESKKKGNERKHPDVVPQALYFQQGDHWGETWNLGKSSRTRPFSSHGMKNNFSKSSIGPRRPATSQSARRGANRSWREIQLEEQVKSLTTQLEKLKTLKLSAKPAVWKTGSTPVSPHKVAELQKRIHDRHERFKLRQDSSAREKGNGRWCREEKPSDKRPDSALSQEQNQHPPKRSRDGWKRLLPKPKPAETESLVNEKIPGLIYDGVPGPGSYRTPSSLAGPSFSFLAKRKQPKDSDVMPGPGQYVVTKQIGKNAVSVSMHSRTHAKTLKEDDVPGPGQYPVIDALKAVDRLGESDFSFASKASRHDSSKASMFDVNPGRHTPGPTGYNIEGTFGKGSTGKSFGGKWNPQAIDSFPDVPNFYFYDRDAFAKDAVKISITPRRKAKEISVDTVPGPGQYPIPTQFKKLKEVQRGSRTL